VRLVSAVPDSAVGALSAARVCRKRATLEPARALALLEEARTWLTVAAEREPVHIELAYERGLTLWRWGTLDPAHVPEAAAGIVEDFGAREGRLPPDAAEALEWARTRTT
jgi:hypothetical protein